MNKKIYLFGGSAFIATLIAGSLFISPTNNSLIEGVSISAIPTDLPTDTIIPSDTPTILPTIILKKIVITPTLQPTIIQATNTPMQTEAPKEEKPQITICKDNCPAADVTICKKGDACDNSNTNITIIKN